MADTPRIARKELAGFFASPAAFLFLGAFLAVTLFVFFWVEAFFARNIADVRPLFQWLPLLLIFLVAALTMRSWSEERRSGTLESLLTSPVSPLSLVLGKFLAGLALVAIALALTLPLPITVSLLGQLDWGPVIGGYLATLFLAAAYLAIGLYMSGRSDNPIVSLILTALACGALYLIGSDTLTSLFGHQVGALLEALGSGSRFESITRGVLDLRDLYYYLSLVGLFLTLNLFSLERLRWAGNPPSPRHRRWGVATTLLAANFLAGNLWLSPLGWARADITDGKLYSLSEATGHYLDQLQEPLLIRGYFSAKTHPLLAPLVPRIEDLLKEYAEAGGDRVRVEFVDPQQDAALEEEAADKYGIRPLPFRVASKYQAGVVNSYFDLLVAYGDQYQTLGFRDLIEVKVRGEEELDVALNNPEYAITRSIRKVVNAYRAGGNPFDNLTRSITFEGYISPDGKLPKVLTELRGELESVLDELKRKAGGRLTVTLRDPDADGGKLAEEIERRYGFRPQVASLLDRQPFWFYMVLDGDGETVRIPLPLELNREELKRSIEAGIQRLAPGFLKRIALAVPPVSPDNPFAGGGRGYQRLREALAEDNRVSEVTLADGRLPADSDLLMVTAPGKLDEKGLFAIDQFLMQGGTVVLATSPFEVGVGRTLTPKRHHSGLEAWLQHNGLTIEEKMVLDPHSGTLPVPVERHIGPIAVREVQMLPYPHFPELRPADGGLNGAHPITANLDQLTLNWASPIRVEEQPGRKVSRLLRSSPESWTSDALDVVPDYRRYPESGFAVKGERGSRLLAVAVEGRFDSFFKGKPSPLARAAEVDGDGEEHGDQPKGPAEERFGGVIERSPESARIVLIASNAFASDPVLELASQGLGTDYTKPLELAQNIVDWSLEDQGLLAIRGRARFARTLAPLSRDRQLFWEYLNYGLALAGLFGVWLWNRRRHAVAGGRYQMILREV